ncbi:unnamed protein product [Peniophora sp. CBMAI 1063]|nr:unnamed protein product [Peniophora sp. CBMAI 1063]
MLFASIMHQLTTLEIIHVYYTPQDMIDTLTHLPSLEHLKLYGGLWTGSFPQTTVHLPHLARCNVHASSAQFFTDLWEHVSAPPTVTIRLVTNDVPNVSHLFKVLRPQLAYASHDCLIVYSSGFSLTCGEPDAEGHHIAGVDWLFASGIDLGRAFIDMIEQIRLHIAVASIRHCELELSSELKYLQFDDADPVIKRLGDAIGALSGVLSSTTALALQGFEPDRTLLRALSPRGTSIPFPNLRTLYLGKNQSSWVGRHRVGPEPAVTTDWSLVEVTLKARKIAGVPLHHLVLAGEWCIRETQTQAWTEQWAQHSIQCRDLDLVKEVKDERTLVTKCETCDIPELEPPELESEGSDED